MHFITITVLSGSLLAHIKPKALLIKFNLFLFVFKKTLDIIGGNRIRKSVLYSKSSLQCNRGCSVYSFPMGSFSIGCFQVRSAAVLSIQNLLVKAEL